MSNSIAATMSPVGATQRKLILGVGIALVLAFAVTVADLEIGGRPDPPNLRASATLLNGPWRFHAGDDPRWADVAIDDRGWETIDMTAQPGSHDGDVGLPDYVDGWMAHGHSGYRGYAWYRRAVKVPEGSASWDILGPTLVEDGYELYWNGRLLGGSGKIGAKPHLVVTRPMQFALPADAAGTQGVLAIRAYMRPGAGASATGGGMHTPPMLAPRPGSDALHRAQWQRTIAGYIVEVVEPLCMLALIALVLVYQSRSSRKGFLVYASIALMLMAVRRLNNAIVAWTDLEDLATYGWLASWMWAPIMAAWIWAWNRWCARPWRIIDGLALVAAVVGIAGAMMHSASLTSGSRLGSLALFLVIGVRMIQNASMRTWALATLISVMAALFGSELLDPIGVPGIWFPFGIGVSRTQYLYAMVITLVAILIVRTIDTERAEPLRR